MSSTVLLGQSMILEGNEWLMLTSEGPVTIRYSLGSDERIGEEVYKGVYSDTGNGELAVFEDVYLREDSLLHQVFLFDSIQQEEFLLYDFSLEVGDTLEFSNYYVEVLQVDSIELRTGRLEKRLELELVFLDGSTRTDTWIETIGSTTTLLYPYKLKFNKFYWGQLDCFFSRGELEYRRPRPGTTSQGCWLVILDNSVEDIRNSSQIKVYPNPLHPGDDLYIETLVEEPNMSRLELYDMFGRVVNSFSFELRNKNPNKLVLKGIENSGVYLYRVYDYSNRIIGSGKLVVQ